MRAPGGQTCFHKTFQPVASITIMPTSALAVRHPTITAEAVREALAAVRHPLSKHRLADSSLVRLDVVERRLSAMAVAPTLDNRAWVLFDLLDELAATRLAQLRTATDDAGAPPTTADAELAAVQADFAAGDHARECWSTLYSRFLSPIGLPMDRVATAAAVGRVTLARRLNDGLALLAAALVVRAAEGPPGAATAPGAAGIRAPAAAARQRVHVTSGSARAAPGTDVITARIVAAVRADDRPGIALADGEARALVQRPPADLTAYRAARVAAWSRPEHALDRRFVRLELVLDAGEQTGGRWRAQPDTFDALDVAIAAAGSPAVVVLGAPGSGKSTLLRRHELDVAAAGLRGETDAVPFLVSLAAFPAANARRAETALPADPAAWLSERWRARQPALPSLDALLDAGRLVLVLDGLNELPHADAAAYHAAVAAWRVFLADRIGNDRGNRAVLSCRSLDYSAPLSSADLRVPHLSLRPLDQGQRRVFLSAWLGDAKASAVEAAMDAAQRALCATPFAARLVVDAVAANGTPPRGAAELVTGLVRRALAREAERGGPLAEPGRVLHERDLRQIALDRWAGPADLPSRGALVPALERLGWHMQAGGLAAGGAQVRLARAEAVAAMADGGAGTGTGSDGAAGAARDDRAGAVVDAGLALGLLDEDPATDALCFSHQRVQEYFAARQLARGTSAGCLAAPWQTAEIAPSVAELIERLPPGEPLPALPSTGFEETARFAAAMVADADAFVRAVLDANAALAGALAAQPDVAPALSANILETVRTALAARRVDPAADIRARIDAALALAPLGDPDLAAVDGPEGRCLVAPLVLLPGGDYPIGRAEPFEALGRTWTARYPPRTVRLAPFALARRPVTNAEWACFMAAGGYDTARWWPSPAAAAWRRGEGTTAGIHASVRAWTARYRAEPDLLAATHASGSYDDANLERWQRRIAMTPSALARHLEESYPSVRHTTPRHWDDPRFNHPALPVVGVTWYEAAAYASWLAAATGRPYRLPTDAELEAAARGRQGREWPWGGVWDAARVNSVTLRTFGPTPPGVLVEGRSPEGLDDLSGNVEEWTTTEADGELVVRGGSWRDNETRVNPAYGASYAPDLCPDSVGVRLACDPGGAGEEAQGSLGGPAWYHWRSEVIPSTNRLPRSHPTHRAAS